MHNVDKEFELVQRNPVSVWRKIHPNREDNNKLNEYFYYKDGKLSEVSYPSVDEATKAHG